MSVLSEWVRYLREHLVVALAAFILAIIGIGYLLYTLTTVAPALRARGELTAQVSEAQAELDNAQRAQQESPERLATQVAAAQTTLDTSLDIFLSESEASGILNALYQYARDSGVAIADLQTQAGPVDEKKSVYNVTTLRLRVAGATPNLLSFVSRIKEAAASGFVISNVTISDDEGVNALTMDISLYTSPFAPGGSLAEVPPGSGALPTPVAPPATTVDQLMQQMNAAWEAQNWPEAIRILEQIRAIDPNLQTLNANLYAAHVNYGFRLIAQGRTEEARAEFNAALTFRPDGVEALAGLQQLTGAAPPPAPAPTSPAQATVYVVRPGDTLFSISRRYGTTVQAIMNANGLTSTNIRSGQQLVIPAP